MSATSDKLGFIALAVLIVGALIAFYLNPGPGSGFIAWGVVQLIGALLQTLFGIEFPQRWFPSRERRPATVLSGTAFLVGGISELPAAPYKEALTIAAILLLVVAFGVFLRLRTTGTSH
jgi:hypothetical protein